MLEKLLDQSCVWSFETSNVSSGHSTHHQGDKKLISCKRVTRFINKVENYRIESSR
jgi:hypothetical protein